MTKTITVTLSESAIKKYADQDNVRELRDPAHPIRFRYRKNRSRGSLYLVSYSGGKDHWSKLANHPDVTIKALLEVLPSVIKRFAVDPNFAPLAANGWTTVGDLLEWYGRRVAADGHLSKYRKTSTKSVLKCHLIPCLGNLPLAELNRATLDARLMWPMQTNNSVSHVRLAFGVLKVAIKQAHSLNLIGVNPLLGVTFTDFIKIKIKPKDARLRPSDVGQLLENWAGRYPIIPAVVALAVLMLAHGTRAGETRQAKWRNFDFDGRLWHIPASDTKTKKAHTLPLTDQVCAFLKRYRATQATINYDGAYLFPVFNGHPVGETEVSQCFRDLSGGEWSSHDLRKTARTAWADLGVDYLIGELLLNHALKALDVTYIHTTAETQKREALERWHAWLDERGFSLLHSLEGSVVDKT
ncbi:tyrosine-type recombinase/integrase [Pseudomonas sp.]|uniref:tyrosine-type recombinase/integrase n=1 Tax=Pseudomonas sp. TaxID=306 RepID=UPI003C793D49